MPFADHDDVIQAFSSSRADHPLRIRARNGVDSTCPTFGRRGEDAIKLAGASHLHSLTLQR